MFVLLFCLSRIEQPKQQNHNDNQKNKKISSKRILYIR